jgi:AcrR family transcriptional regulator
MSRELQKQQTRSNILQTAERLFKEKGYNQVSTRAIAKEANVGVGTVFSHFADKAQLTKALFHDKLETHLNGLYANTPAGLSGKKFFYFYAESLYQLYAEDRNFSIALLQSAPFELDYFKEQVENYIQLIAHQLTEDKPKLEEAHRYIIAKAFFGFYITHLVCGLKNESTMPVDWLKGLQHDCEQLWAVVE